MADDLLLLSAAPGETRAAVVERGRVVEFAILRDDQVVGAVWLGRVTAVRRGTAFVEIGLARPGVLPAGTLSEGDAVLAQAQSDPHHDKGARLTAQVSLTGRLLALSPQRPGVAASRRIAPEERARLLAIAKGLAAPGEGVVLRTAAAGHDREALAAELAWLRRRWADLQARVESARAPALLLPADPVGRLLSDHPAISGIIVDDAAAHAALRAVHGDMVRRDPAAFDLYDAAELLERALDPVVPLPSGGSLVIEPTAAAVLVDVNSGSGDPNRGNDEAVDALARQMRLRNLSGHILFDAIPSHGKGALKRLVERLRRAVAEDPVVTEVVGTTPLGLIEMTRERRRAALSEVLLETRLRRSAETVALDALRRVLADAAGHGEAPTLLVAPEVAAALSRLGAAVAETERRLALPLAIEARDGWDREMVEVLWTPGPGPRKQR